ncbi:MAG: hypothetical protein ACKOW9_05075 [Candidatus Paceibacterota bacterium]
MSKEYKPTVNDVIMIVNDLKQGVPLAATARKLPSGKKDDKVNIVLDTIGTFGTWLTHSMTSNDLSTRAKKQISLKLPDGYEPSSWHKRDVSKALSAILTANPDNETIARFVARTYRTRSSDLSYPIVAGVWFFAKNGRLSRLENVSADPVFYKQCVDAYDLLDGSRLSAISSVRKLASGVLKPASAIRAVKDAAWLDEPSMNKIERSLTKQDGKYEALISSLNRRVLLSDAMLAPVNVSALNAGQVMRICEKSGLKVQNEFMSEETEIRTRIRSMGLSVDSDRLVPEALRALAHDKLEAFWDVLQARLDGDNTWGEQLEELARNK